MASLRLAPAEHALAELDDLIAGRDPLRAGRFMTATCRAKLKTSYRRLLARVVDARLRRQAARRPHHLRRIDWGNVDWSTAPARAVRTGTPPR